MRRRPSVNWENYLSKFHRSSAGITEDLLDPATDETGLSPYQWLVEILPERTRRTIDIGCGSAPTDREGIGWIGVDRSLGELRRGRAKGRTPLVQGDAVNLPFAEGCASAAICSMSLMVVHDPVLALAEARRILEPGASLLVLVPAGAPMRMRDRFRMGLIMAIVGTVGFPFPHRDVLRNPAGQIREAGFVVFLDETRRFAVPLQNPDDGERFVQSLYLPGIAVWRVRLVHRVARRWRGELGVPLRRIVGIAGPAT